MSRATDAAVGMMDAAYFIGRRELLDFFNTLLELNLTKIEETATGAVACQMTEMIFPGSIPMARVNWEARSDYEFVQNYKLLQNAFNKHHVQRFVDVNKLIRAKYQDNLEFCQWLKAFYDQSGVFRDDYDPMAVRAKGKGGKAYNAKLNTKRGIKAKPRPAGHLGIPKTNPVVPKPEAASKPVMTTRPHRPIRPRLSEESDDSLLIDTKESIGGPANDALAKENERLTEEKNALVEENETLSSQVAELTLTVTTLEEAVLETEQERQFYFDKLRNVEVLLQVYQESSTSHDVETSALMDKIFKILYATAEDNYTVNDDGEVVVASLDHSNEDESV
ncbi:microtubule-associated protein, RP/EB family [Fistulifera solaris]|uniref:Microtubule-associated protein, RP/EB family n=1 Tax=Fistulifera solaris TaxID=1519565 RepID=A0A1Z5KB38_FISSO|nr:microtubule-associated protein, RP/EB family [Fistulifera solaris]|eukprot:GAX23355.1 microtubule-associated protein, RP/EB family [Fistulifera solaris]